MGVQLPRSPVRLSLFRCSSLSLLCPTLFVLLSGSLCSVVRLSRSPLSGFFVSLSDFFVSLSGSLCFVVPLPRLIRLVLFLSRAYLIYTIFFLCGSKIWWSRFHDFMGKTFSTPKAVFRF